MQFLACTELQIFLLTTEVHRVQFPWDINITRRQVEYSFMVPAGRRAIFPRFRLRLFGGLSAAIAIAIAIAKAALEPPNSCRRNLGRMALWPAGTINEYS